MIAALYTRKSTEDERSEADGKSVARQAEHAAQFAARQLGAAVRSEFTYQDDGISGAEFVNRPGLQRLLADVRRRPAPFQALVISEPSRLGREQIETAYALKTITDAGVRVYSYLTGREITLGTAVDKLIASVQHFASEAERETGAKRTRDALVRKARLGHATGARTYGYALVRKGEHTERRVDEAQAAIVKRVFELAAVGYGDKRIGLALTADKVPAPSAKGWNKGLVRTMLRNPIYRGVSVFGRTHSVDRGGSAGKRQAVPKNDWVTTPVPHLRIVSDEVWEKVQARKARTRAHYLRTPAGKLLGKPESGLAARYLLNGILRCSSCGGAMGVNIKDARNGRTRRYYCHKRHRGGCTNGRGVPMATVDCLVLEKLQGLLDPDHWEELRTKIAKRVYAEEDEALRRYRHQERDRAATEAEVTKLEGEISRLIAALASGVASADVTRAINERRAKVEALRAKLAAPTIRPDWDALKKGLNESFAAVLRARFRESDAYRTILRRSGKLVDKGQLTDEGKLTDPVELRQVMRRIGVDRIVVTPDETGWTFEGLADLGRLVHKGSPEGAVEAPLDVRCTSRGRRRRGSVRRGWSGRPARDRRIPATRRPAR